MLRFKLIAAGLLSAYMLLAAPLSSSVPGELLIVPAKNVSSAAINNLIREHGGKPIKELPKIKTHKAVFSSEKLQTIEDALKKHPLVDSVERNIVGSGERTVPNDPGFPNQWHLPNIWAPAGWDITQGSSLIVIAVIDSGVDAAHADLKANVIAGYNFLSSNTNTGDVQGHGTAVAGAASAVGNSGVGIAGVCWRCKIMPLVVLDSTNKGTVADVSEAIIYAADNGAHVINLSLAFTTSSVTLANAINYAWSKGLVIVAAAANYNTNKPYYPAANSNVLAVSATDRNNQKTSWSNYGNWIDVAAPGVDIYTTKRGGGYWWTYGTSLATPQVAALAALVWSVNPKLTNIEVANLIKANASDFGAPGFDSTYGWGRINVFKTLSSALN